MLFSAVHWIKVNEEQFYFDAKICTLALYIKLKA